MRRDYAIIKSKDSAYLTFSNVHKSITDRWDKKVSDLQKRRWRRQKQLTSIDKINF